MPIKLENNPSHAGPTLDSGLESEFENDGGILAKTRQRIGAQSVKHFSIRRHCRLVTTRYGTQGTHDAGKEKGQELGLKP